MNFNDRDNLTILYYQIFVKDIKPEKLGIDYVRLERLYNDPKTLKKYKIIIKGHTQKYWRIKIIYI